ncbi:MAG: hypothetical protein AAFO04_08690 [Cyanobacteria bacterium J06592_8]
MQTWLSDLLEELKLNYIQKANNDDPEYTLAEAEKLRQKGEEDTI